MKKIMFICTGNVCRSPMAKYYFNKVIETKKLQDKYIGTSCGIYSVKGEHATDNAIEAMKDYDVDMTSHKATRIQDSQIMSCDLIITLTIYHKNVVVKMYPELAEKVYTLKEYVNPKVEYKDIDDPWGLDINTYKFCAKEITENIDKMIEKLEEGK